uniref:Uncharacterized protein n=2 Tax=Opuntia streptacantha TaxID=393608 RepID=A0A7C9EHV6_OPUST
MLPFRDKKDLVNPQNDWLDVNEFIMASCGLIRSTFACFACEPPSALPSSVSFLSSPTSVPKSHGICSTNGSRQFCARFQDRDSSKSAAHIISHMQRASLNDNSLRKRTRSIRKAKIRLSAPMWDKCENISLSVTVNMCHSVCNCFITPVCPSMRKFSRVLRRSISKHQNASASFSKITTNGDNRSLIPWQYPVSGSTHA